MLSEQRGIRASRKSLQQREEASVRPWVNDFKLDVDENTCESRICAALSSWSHNIKETSSS